MLKIIVNNKEVDLGELKGITLQYNGGIFEFNKIEGSYTIPFNIPMSDRNREIFEFPDRTETINNIIREYDAEIWHSGILIEMGILTAKIFNYKTITCSFLINNGNLYNKIKSKKLIENNFGGDKPFVFKGFYDFNTDDFLLYEVKNETFLKDSIWETYGEDWYEEDEVGHPSDYVSGYENITGWDRNIHPYLYFLVRDSGTYKSLYAYETEEDRYNQTNPVFYVTDTGTIYETYSSGYGGTLGFIERSAIIGDKFKVRFSEHKNYQNFYEHNPLDPPEYGKFFLGEYVPSIITPFPLLYRVLEYIIKGLGFNYSDTFFTNEYRRINIFNVNNAVQPEEYWINGEGPYIKNKLETYNIANHLPDISTEEFIISVQNFFNIFFYLQDGKVTVKDRQELLSNINFDDYSSKKILFLDKKLNKENSGYILSTEKDQNDDNIKWVVNYGERENVLNNLDYNILQSGQVYHDFKLWTIFKYLSQISVSGKIEIMRGFQWLPGGIDNAPVNLFRNLHYFQSFSHGDKGFKINLGITTLSDYDEQLGLYYHDSLFLFHTESVYYNIPIVKMKGNSYINNDESKNKFKLILMTYLAPYEIKPNRETTYDPYGTQQTDNITLSPEWAYHNRWKSFIEWYQKTSSVIFNMEIPLKPSEIKHFDFTKKKLINGELYFIKSFKIHLLRNSIAPAKAVLIKA